MARTLLKRIPQGANWDKALAIFSEAAWYWVVEEDEAWVDKLRRLYPDLDARSRAGNCK
jgi:hypothetical protein